MKPQRPVAVEEEHRILQFRPRSALHTPAWQGNTAPQRQESAPEPLDLSRYERPREEEDDFRQRMLANVAAFAFTVALTAVAIWLAMSIADLRRTQDCVLMGRHDCVHISPP
jgi:ferric-dicitrate binding protein FerR (iron transport regulator)